MAMSLASWRDCFTGGENSWCTGGEKLPSLMLMLVDLEPMFGLKLSETTSLTVSELPILSPTDRFTGVRIIASWSLLKLFLWLCCKIESRLVCPKSSVLMMELSFLVLFLMSEENFRSCIDCEFVDLSRD